MKPQYTDYAAHMPITNHDSIQRTKAILDHEPWHLRFTLQSVELTIPFARVIACTLDRQAHGDIKPVLIAVCS